MPIISALVMAASFSGCSAARLGYNSAPSLAAWWLDGYLDFDADQSAKVRTELDALIAWHRKEELPQFAATLKNLRGVAAQTITPEQVCSLYTFTLVRTEGTAERMVAAVATLAPTLQPTQLEHMARQFDKRNREWQEEWMHRSASEVTDRRVEKLVERAESFYGRLDTAQRSAVRANVLKSAFDANLTYREVLRRQQDTLQTFKHLRAGIDSESEAQASVRALLERTFNSPDSAYRQYRTDMSTQSCAAIANLHNSTNPNQRRKLAQVLLDYENDVRALMSP